MTTKQGFWANAFAVNTRDPLTTEEKAWLDTIAEKIIQKSMREPAMIFLESTKPLHFVAGQAARFLDPIFSLVVAQSRLQNLAELLEKRQAAEHLICALENHEHEPSPRS